MTVDEYRQRRDYSGSTSCTPDIGGFRKSGTICSRFRNLVAVHRGAAGSLVLATAVVVVALGAPWLDKAQKESRASDLLEQFVEAIRRRTHRTSGQRVRGQRERRRWGIT